MCAIVWSILATKLAGKTSSLLLTAEVADLLMDSVQPYHPIQVRIFSLIAIQSFTATRK